MRMATSTNHASKDKHGARNDGLENRVAWLESGLKSTIIKK